MEIMETVDGITACIAVFLRFQRLQIRIVIPEVAGSSPVGHPENNLILHRVRFFRAQRKDWAGESSWRSVVQSIRLNGPEIIASNFISHKYRHMQRTRLKGHNL